MAQRVIIFGTGKNLEQYTASINLIEIDIFVDNNPQLQGTILFGKPVLSPQEILKRNFDYVVIFSTKYFAQIYQQLLYELAVPIEKIIDFKTYVESAEYGYLQLYEQIQKLVQILRGWNLKSLLDVDMVFSKRYFLCKQSSNLFGNYEVSIDACSNGRRFSIYKNVYQNIFSDVTRIDRHYDMILFCDWRKFSSWQDYSDVLELTKEHARYVAFCLPFPYGAQNAEKFCYLFSRFGKLRKIQCNTFYLFIIDKQTEEIPLDLQIFVITHKKFIPPQDDGYVPLQAGKLGKESLGYLGDDTGDHISHLNPYINECTALYWMWKQAKCEYIGLNHYRRYFLRNEICSRENIIDKETVREILKDYDIILVNEQCFYPRTVGESVMYDTNEELYHKAYNLVRDLIGERQSEYVEAFDYVMSGYVFFECNMFITKKEIMDRYCTWLFSFLLDAVRRLDVRAYNSYNQRMMGFFAERMLTVWLMCQKLRIKEMPIIKIL